MVSKGGKNNLLEKQINKNCINKYDKYVDKMKIKY